MEPKRGPNIFEPCKGVVQAPNHNLGILLAIVRGATIEKESVQGVWGLGSGASLQIRPT